MEGPGYVLINFLAVTVISHRVVSGQSKVLHIANLFTMAFSLGCAFSPDVGSLIAFRFLCTQSYPSSSAAELWLTKYIDYLAGLSGSSPIAIGGGSVSDVFSERDRASAMAIFTLGPLVGSYLLVW